MYRKVMVGFDGSPCAGMALREGVQMAAAGAGLLVLTVVPRRQHAGSLLPPSALDMRQARALQEQTRQYLAQHGASAEQQLIDLGTQADSTVAAAMVAAATAAGVDLIIMGTHGRSGFGRFLLGHVAESVSRLAPCPVLLVGLPAATGFSCLNPLESFGMWPEDESLRASR